MTLSPKLLLPALILAFFAQILEAQAHPRLLFGPEDLPALREKVTREPFKTMFEVLKADAETGQYRFYDGPTPESPNLPADPYGECVNAVRLGFIYLITEDDYYANRARFYVERRINDQSVHRWANSGQKGLNLYYNGKSVALVYDWCFGAPSWDSAFSTEVSAKLLAQANVIADSGGTEQNKNSASNWQGLRGSSAVLCFLATDEAYSSSKYSSMLNKTERYLEDNLGTGPLSRGWNIEGIGYLGYPYATVIPGIIAAERDNTNNAVAKDLAAMDYALWTQYAATVRFLRGDEVWLLHPDFGDDNATADDANGMYGFAFAYSHPDLLPGLKYWYNRLLIPENNWDYTRAGTIFSILHYPDDITEVPPLEIPAWRDGFIDTGGNGFFTYRNQYEDETDMVAQMYLKLRGNKGHNGPDALSFRILGLNTAWAVGGGRYGAKTNGQDVFLRSQNTVYPVDPDSTLSISGNSGRILGTPTVHPEGDGHVVSTISQNNVGTRNHKRWFASDYSQSAGVDAVYIIGDRSDDGFFWQFNTLEENALSLTENGFLVEGFDGATLKATVLYPTGPHLATLGTRPRGSKFAYGLYGENNHFYHLQGSGDYLVVLTVANANQVHPTVNHLQGRIAPSVIEVGSNRYALLDATVERDPSPLILPDPVPAPDGLTALPSSNFPEIVLSWNSSLGAQGYILERSDNGGPFKTIANIKNSASTTVDNNLPGGIDFAYRVKAWNEAGDSLPSPVATTRLPDTSGSGYIATESFEDYEVGALGGNNGAGGWNGPWTYGATEVVDVSANPLTANGLSGGDRAIQLSFGDIIGTRQFAQNIPSSSYGDGVWFSYLLRWDSGSVDGDDYAWLFNTNGNRDWAYAGLVSNASFRVSDWYKSGNGKTSNFSPGETVQVVVKVTRTKIDLWLDPVSENDPPLVSSTVSNSKGWRAGFPGLGISSRSQNDVFLMDRIIVARSFADLTNEPANQSAFALWQSSFQWPSEADSLATADPDKDGLSNRSEYSHGFNPLSATQWRMQIQRRTEGDLSLLIPLRSTEALSEISLQSTKDLSTWMELASSSPTIETTDDRTFARFVLTPEQTEGALYLRIVYPELP